MKYFYILLFITIHSIVFSQTAIIKGFVYDKETGEPVIFTPVKLKGTEFGMSTDVNGYFSLSKVPPGDYILTVTSLIYKEIEESVSVKSGDIVLKKLYVEDASKNLNEVIVSGEKQEAKTEVKMSVIKVTAKDINAVPTIGGESDVATYFQIVPGVVSTGDQGGQMYVRGGSPIQNKILLDGMTIYNPFHSIGFFSVFDTEIIKNADIYTGGYSAEYGGRISSIMDIRTKDGNSKNIGGRISFNTFGAKATLEGPLKKAKTDNEGSITYVLSGKTSYLNESSKALYQYVDSNGLPYSFTDLFGKISFNGSNGSKINFFGFNFKDKVKYQNISDLDWDSYGLGTSFILVPGTSPVLIEGRFNYSNYEVSLQEAGSDLNSLNQRYSRVNGFGMGFDFKYFIKENELRYGVEVGGFNTNYSFFNAVGRKISQEENTTELAAYLNYKIVAGRCVIEPSFRTHYYATLKNFSPEPRLGLKYNVTENYRLKFATGVYSQNLISSGSDRDIVNLFYGFLSGPENLPDSYIDENGNEQDRKHSLQKATHFILGNEFDLGKRITLNVEGYYKRFNQLTNINRNKVFDESDEEAPELLKNDYIIETGDAYGVDFSLKYTGNKMYLWSVYSLGKVTRWDGIRTYSPVFDRRHNINIVGAYTFGKNRSWELNGRWNYGSGLPFTPTQGFYNLIDFSSGVNTDVTTANSNEVAILYGDLNTKRLPSYHRFDLTLKKKFVFSKQSELEVILGATNVYNRNNIFYVNRVSNEVIYQLPFLPSVGVNWRF